MEILKSLKLINIESEIKINIQGTHENPLFQANHIGLLLDLTNINQSIMNFSEKYKVIQYAQTNGGMQKTAFLTEIGLYKLLSNSNKKITEHYQNWAIETIKELRTNGIYKINENNNEIEKNLIKYKGDVDKHNALVKTLDNKNVVYICRFKLIGNKILIKIGSTQNIKERLNNIKYSFENIDPIIIDLIEVYNHVKFESFLHKNEFIKNFSYDLVKKDNKVSTETYLVTNDELNEILNITNSNKYSFKEFDHVLLKKIKDIDNFKLTNTESHNDIKKLTNIHDILINIENKINNTLVIHNQLKNIIDIKNNNFIEKKEKIISYTDLNREYNDNNDNNDINDQEIDSNSNSNSNNSDEDDIDLTTAYFSTKKITKFGIKVPLVYQYSHDNLITPIKIYNSPSDVERDIDLKSLGISPAPLRLASRNNTIYKGYRWLFLNRNEILPESISETVLNKHKEPEIKFIAMIDITKTKILAVYPNQKEATKARLMKCNSFHRAIKNESISSGHYWKYFEDCSIEMQNEYFKNNILPEKYVSSCCKKVQQICPLTKNILKTYDSNREVIKLFKMSVSSLKKYNESGEVHNGYIWKIV
jgi:prophage antirepressor-like protein